VIGQPPLKLVTYYISKSKAVQLRHEGAKGERLYCFYSFLASALDEVSGQRHARAALLFVIKFVNGCIYLSVVIISNVSDPWDYHEFMGGGEKRKDVSLWELIETGGSV
jgi:hypothetical protein